MTLLAQALLTDFAIPLVSTEDFLLNPAAFVGQAILYKATNGTTRLWRATEVSPDTGGPFGFNIGWELLYGLRFALGSPISQNYPQSTPYGIGEWYVATNNDVTYLAKGTQDTDWIVVGGGGGGS
jgi:hypothetical protein